MTVALIRPYFDSYIISPPLGLGYISSFLAKHGIKVVLIDALQRSLSLKKILGLCQDIDIIGISCYSASFLETIRLSRELKALGKKVIIGGPHASVLPEVTLAKTRADCVIVGEGERAVFDVVQNIKDGARIPSIVNNKIANDLNDQSYPDWVQMDPRDYSKAPHGIFIKNFPVAPVITTRGCPFSCNFCASPSLWGGLIRYRQPSGVVDEIGYLNKKFGVKEIHFEDDNLTFRRSHIAEICELILGRGLKVSWATPHGVRADTLDLELLKLMKKSGCYSLTFGIESGDQKILDSCGKKMDLGILEETINNASELGIITQGFFIFGLLGETAKSIRRTIDFSQRLKLKRAYFNYIDIIPGSLLWKDFGWRLNNDWRSKDFSSLKWIPPTVNKLNLVSSVPVAFFKFYMRPSQLYDIVKNLRVSQLRYFIRRLFKVAVRIIGSYF